MVVKVGLDGRAYVDGAVVSKDELMETINALKRGGDGFTYYRESPATAGTDAATATFQAILDMHPRIRLGSDAPSEWGRLEWVEFEEGPSVSRLFLARGERFLISMPPSPENPKPQVVVGGPLTAASEDPWFGQIDLILRSDRVIETPPHHPEFAMHHSALSEPSLHLRIAYDRLRWASWYPSEKAPSHIVSFQRDLWRLARIFLSGLEQTSLSTEQARRLSP